MTPERWKQVEEVFQSVIERAPNERIAFLARRCAGDETLRDEVQLLIAAHDEAGSFIENPAFDAPHNLFTHESLVGRSIGRYEILASLGVGGMGEVYLAQDQRLGRKVALKLLLSDFTRDRDRLHRFKQEARATSALSHPNVCAIYEVGETEEGRYFIAMEYVDGITLRQLMTDTRMELRKVIDIASQVASALTAAHSAGIVHRDIKPENILLRTDGYVKVVDFGLCKLTENRAADLAPATVNNTDPNMLLGTPRYMSPEQVRGLKVDVRTDIWSLGVMLYEMVAGAEPFDGSSMSEMIVSILEREPPPLTRHAQEAPEALQLIVTQALRKDREERYQTAKELFADLRSLKHQLELKVELERSTPPDSSSGSSVRSGERSPSKTITGSARTSETTILSTAAHFINEIKHHQRWVVLVLAALLITAAAMTFGLYKLLGRDHTTAKSVATAPQEMRVTRLTTNGNARETAISADGKYVVSAMNEAGRQSLWIRQVASMSSVRIIPPAEVEYRGLAFSHDGAYVYYVVAEKNSLQRVLYQVPVLGGHARKVIADVGGPVTFSPDGTRFAFVRRYQDQKEDALVVASIDGSDERKLASRKHPEIFDWSVGPAWSPDEKVIAAAVRSSDAQGSYTNVIEVDGKDGRERILSSRKWQWVGQMAWLRDGSGLVMTAKDQESSFQQIWQISYPGGAAHKIINDFSDYTSMSLTGNSKTLASVREDLISNIWITSNTEAGRAPLRITSEADRYYDLSWTPDGKILYASDSSGSADIWQIEADGTGQKRLTAGARRNYAPAVSPDGRHIFFHSNRTGNWNIWRMDIDGSNPKQLTSGNEDSNWPQCSPDGQWVVYQRLGSDTLLTLWKVSVDGSPPIQLTDKLSSRPSISPDGQWIACWYNDGPANSPWRIAVIPFAGGRPIKVFDISSTVAAGPEHSLHWSPDGRALTYVDARSGMVNIWSQPVDGGKAVQLTDLQHDQIFSFNWSRDGRLAYSRGLLTSDVVLISNFR